MLHYAASNGHINVISYLLRVGADPNIQGEVSICRQCYILYIILVYVVILHDKYTSIIFHIDTYDYITVNYYQTVVLSL